MTMCNDLTCTLKLTRNQLSLAYRAKVKTDMPREKKRKTAGVRGVDLSMREVTGSMPICSR